MLLSGQITMFSASFYQHGFERTIPLKLFFFLFVHFEVRKVSERWNVVHYCKLWEGKNIAFIAIIVGSHAQFHDNFGYTGLGGGYHESSCEAPKATLLNLWRCLFIFCLVDRLQWRWPRRILSWPSYLCCLKVLTILLFLWDCFCLCWFSNHCNLHEKKGDWDCFLHRIVQPTARIYFERDVGKFVSLANLFLFQPHVASLLCHCAPQLSCLSLHHCLHGPQSSGCQFDKFWNEWCSGSREESFVRGGGISTILHLWRKFSLRAPLYIPGGWGSGPCTDPLNAPLTGRSETIKMGCKVWLRWLKGKDSVVPSFVKIQTKLYQKKIASSFRPCDSEKGEPFSRGGWFRTNTVFLSGFVSLWTEFRFY